MVAIGFNFDNTNGTSTAIEGNKAMANHTHILTIYVHGPCIEAA